MNELWALVEAECEELRVLQTVPPLVSAELLVTGNALAKVGSFLKYLEIFHFPVKFIISKKKNYF